MVSYSSDDRLVFRGAVLEGLNGKSLDKRLEEDPSFCDIDFLLGCLQKVGPTVTYLTGGQRCGWFGQCSWRAFPTHSQACAAPPARGQAQAASRLVFTQEPAAAAACRC